MQKDRVGKMSKGLKMSEKSCSKFNRLDKVLSPILAATVLVTLVIRFAEPVRDGDLWWQMAYGRYLLQHKTLITDHTIFSWGPSVKDLIYCSWLSEIFLYLLYLIGGLSSLFMFRYACLGLFVLLFWREARKRGISGQPMVWLVCLLGLLMSYTAAFIRPDIFSYVLMSLMVWTAWQIKSPSNNGKWYCYLLPLLLLIWVNSHGGFIFGVAFLSILLIGETLNVLLASEHALNSDLRRHFYAALSLCALAVFITPYGWNYPVQLTKDILLGGIKINELESISDFASIFHPQASLLHFKEYLIVAIVILLVLFWRQRGKGKTDWTLVLANLAFAWLYTRFLRSTHYWAMIFALSCLSLLAADRSSIESPKKNIHPIVSVAICLLGLLVGARAIYDAECRPFAQRWCGFGNSYQNPVPEAEFIKQNLSKYRLGNDYNSSGYLIWALWPETKVFYGPPLYSPQPWSNDYLNFLNGRDPEGFTRKFPFEVWCISYSYERVVDFFRYSPEWELAFYGPSAAVFVRKDVVALPFQPQTPAAGGIENIRNLNQAIRVLKFAISINDLCAARKIAAGIEQNFKCPNQHNLVLACQQLVKGMVAYYRRDYKRSAEYLQLCQESKLLTNETALVKSYLYLTAKKYKSGDYRQALRYAQAAQAIAPDNLYAAFNAGVLCWYTERTVNHDNKLFESKSPEDFNRPVESCRRHLATFLKIVDGRFAVPEQVALTARKILNETYEGLPRVIVPPEPDYKDFETTCRAG